VELALILLPMLSRLTLCRKAINLHFFTLSFQFPCSFSSFLSFSSPFFLLPIIEEECLNLIIGGDVIACKNKALKSFVLFPRYVEESNQLYIVP
jgi:hypothetical protein